MQLIKDPATLKTLSPLMLYYFSFGMLISQLAIFLNARFTWNGQPFGPVEVGYVFTAAGAINILAQLFFMKTISRRFTSYQITTFSFLLLAAGYLGIGLTSHVGTLSVAIIAMSLGMALVRPSLISSLSLAVPHDQQGTAMGINQALMSIANIVAPIIAGLLIGLHWYNAWTFTIAGIVLIGAIISKR